MIEEKILLRRGRQPGWKQGDIAAVGTPQLNTAQGPAASKTAPECKMRGFVPQLFLCLK